MAVEVGVRGNTLTFTIVFRDSADAAVDPDGNVSYVVKDQDNNEIATGTILLADKTATGTFELDYTVPDEDWISVQFSALVDGKTELGRVQVNVVEFTP